MPKKKDPSVTFLNKFGYNVVKLPRAGIEPMDVIGRDDTTQWLGPLSSVWSSTAPEPSPRPPKPAAAVNGQKTDQLEVGFGLKILANALSAFGATVPSLEFAYKRARKVQFSYVNVTSTAVAPLEAGNFLAEGKLNTQNPVVAHYMTGMEAEAFLIMDVLKSDAITVIAVDDNGQTIGVDIPAIQSMVGATVNVSSGNSANSTITYTGTAPVTFGFIVDAIQFDGTRWSLEGAAPDGALAFSTAGAAAGTVTAAAPILLGTGCRVRL